MYLVSLPLAEMVTLYKGQEIVIGFVGDAKDHATVEVTWALLIDYD
jgi:hypothetical protein